MCEALNEETADLDGHADCSRCGPTVKLDWKNTPRILEHMGAHILHDTTLNSSEERCGLCLRPAPMCQVYLTKGRGTAGKVSVDRSKSKCPNLARFNYKNTAQSSKRSPCSNVPVVCTLCPPGSPAAWMYSIVFNLTMKDAIVSFHHYIFRPALSCPSQRQMGWSVCGTPASISGGHTAQRSASLVTSHHFLSQRPIVRGFLSGK